MSRFIFFFVYISVALTSCKHETQFNEVVINNNYTLQIPEYLVPSNGMHPQASAQYENTEKEFYLLVIDESKENMEAYDLDYDIDTYYKNIVSTPFKEFVKNGKISIPGRQQINGAKALIADIEGEINNNQIFYKLAVVETADKFYQIVCWVPLNRREVYEKEMLKVIESINEVKK